MADLQVHTREQFYVYGIHDFISDAGGWLGLLTGYSILGFYDTFSMVFSQISRVCKII